VLLTPSLDTGGLSFRCEDDETEISFKNMKARQGIDARFEEHGYLASCVAGDIVICTVPCSKK